MRCASLLFYIYPSLREPIELITQKQPPSDNCSEVVLVEYTLRLKCTTIV